MKILPLEFFNETSSTDLTMKLFLAFWVLIRNEVKLKWIFVSFLADVVSEDAILKWYKETHSARGWTVFMEQMKKFVEWLEHAEEGELFLENLQYSIFFVKSFFSGPSTSSLFTFKSLSTFWASFGCFLSVVFRAEEEESWFLFFQCCRR